MSEERKGEEKVGVIGRGDTGRRTSEDSCGWSLKVRIPKRMSREIVGKKERKRSLETKGNRNGGRR